MARLIIIFILFLNFKISFGQNKSEQTFKEVINEGFSTGPDLAVVTIKNFNTGEIKEIMIQVTTLFESCMIELQIQDHLKILEYLLKNSDSRLFEFKNKEALED